MDKKPVPMQEIQEILDEVMQDVKDNRMTDSYMPNEYVRIAHFLENPEEYEIPLPNKVEEDDGPSKEDVKEIRLSLILQQVKALNQKIDQGIDVEANKLERVKLAKTYEAIKRGNEE